MKGLLICGLGGLRYVSPSIVLRDLKLENFVLEIESQQKFPMDALLFRFADYGCWTPIDGRNYAPGGAESVYLDGSDRALNGGNRKGPNLTKRQEAGTVGRQAPETIIWRSRIGPLSDLWAFARVMHEAMAGFLLMRAAAAGAPAAGAADSMDAYKHHEGFPYEGDDCTMGGISWTTVLCLYFARAVLKNRRFQDLYEWARTAVPGSATYTAFDKDQDEWLKSHADITLHRHPTTGRVTKAEYIQRTKADDGTVTQTAGTIYGFITTI